MESLNPPQSIFNPPLGTRGYKNITWAPHRDTCILFVPSEEVHLVVFTHRGCQKAAPPTFPQAHSSFHCFIKWHSWLVFEVSATLVRLKVSYAGVFSFSDSQAHHRSTAPPIGACRISHRSPSTAPMRSSLMPEVGVVVLSSILIWTSILAFKLIFLLKFRKMDHCLFAKCFY